MSTETPVTFAQLALSETILSALNEVGYETPSPIQAQTIPYLLEGRDVVGQAQTGTGKTAAFALPLLSRLSAKAGKPQILVLTPTRELSIQVAEAFQKYARHIPGFQVLPIYGGQDYGGQIRALQRGVHVVVGTPGRVTDHMRRGTLRLDQLTTLVLDEADEMLRMGFIDDVEWILEQTPDQRQVALFSATMPPQIRRIAQSHLNNPAEVTIKEATSTAATIRQRYWPVSGVHKLDALTRILEAEPFDALLIFVRTKLATVELADKLSARGFAAAALNGDIQQSQRERTVEQLKNGRLDILVATDVAARGLDVARVSHVINYDIPYDTESYVHRIGRTGRAGKTGDAILFVASRERRMLAAIERATRQKIDVMSLPTTDQINDKRIARFKQRILEASTSEGNELFVHLIEQIQQEHNIPAVEIAAALAALLQGETPFLLSGNDRHKPTENWETRQQAPRERDAGKRPRKKGRENQASEGMEVFRIEVGHEHEITASNIVGAIANEAGMDSKHIGRIQIEADHSTVELPPGMPGDILQILKRARVAGRPMNIERISPAGESFAPGDPSPRPKKPRKDRHPKTKPGKPAKTKIRHKDRKAKGKPPAAATGKPIKRRPRKERED